MDLDRFAKPSKEYRPSPFWAWNDDLQEDELRRQIRDMKEKGFGGFFMHSRDGLITEYLSEAWMKAIAVSLDEGKRQNMEAWLYDEDRWPSGAAGGLVSALNPEFVKPFLVCEEWSREAPEEAPIEPVALFSIEFDEKGRIVRAAPVPPASGGCGSTRGAGVYSFHILRYQHAGWFNGESYVDLLNPEVTRAFLRLTHDAYAERFGAAYGEFMPGIFTDEPSYTGWRGVPWTRRLPVIFAQRLGYDLLPKLPLLFFDGAGAAKVRYDFYRTCTDLFLESFTKPIFAHCEKRRLAFTGHFNNEDTLIGQVRNTGAVMPHYEFMHVPGIDHLCRNINQPLTLKQVSSAAHQFGRKRVLSELFGVSGQSMSFEDQKWIADWHFALGITFMNPHLTLYSMKGQRKRDFPPTLSYHQPYWPWYRRINDYLARCSYAVSQGDAVADILLLHPIASAWCTYRPGTGVRPWEKEHIECEKGDREFATLIDNLLGIQRDFDLGDETIMSRHACVDACEVVVGKMRYSILIMPPSVTWSASTFELLTKFTRAGGYLICVGQLPTLIDGEVGHELRKFFTSENILVAENNPESLRQTLDKLLPADVIVTDEDGARVPEIRYNHRRSQTPSGDEHYFFFANTSRTRAINATISLRVGGGARELLPAEGTERDAGAEMKAERLTIQAEFPPVGSRIFIVNTQDLPVTVESHVQKTVTTIPLHNHWSFRRKHPNSIPLDYCRYGIDNEPPGERLPVWKARTEIRERLGLGPYKQWQPWALIKKGVKPNREARVKLLFQVEVREPPKAAFLAIEQAHRFELKVNEHDISTRTNDWHWDEQFGKIEVSEQLREGMNHIKLTTDFQLDTEIEDIYLIGDFGVFKGEDGFYHISSEADQLKDGDWGPQGYPFYAGNMIYWRDISVTPEEGKRYSVRLLDPKGTLHSISVNGSERTPLCWQPWELDITGELRSGENRIEIEVCGSLRNTFGPLHHKAGESLFWVGPESFEDEKNWTDDYLFAPYGLLRGAEIIVTE